MIKYKLTTQNLTTYDDFQWEVGKKYTTSGKGDLCGPGYLHYYHHPLLAVLLNPIHGNFEHPKLFEVEAGGTHKDDNGLKGGCTEMTLVREIPLPELTITQRVAFSILTSLEVCKNGGYREWAENWLSNKDRSEEAAEAARATAWAAEAARAIRAAIRAARAAQAAEVAWATAEAAEVAWATAEAACAAAEAAKPKEALNHLIKYAEKCLDY